MLNIFEYTFFGAALPYSAAVTVSPAIENEILFSIWDFLPRTYQVRTTCSLKPLCVEYLLLVFMLKIASLHRSCMSVLTNSLSLMDSGRIFLMSSKNFISKCLVFNQILSLETKAFLTLEDTFPAL